MMSFMDSSPMLVEDEFHPEEKPSLSDSLQARRQWRSDIMPKRLFKRPHKSVNFACKWIIIYNKVFKSIIPPMY